MIELALIAEVIDLITQDFPRCYMILISKEK
jgi:hypothetical protein